MRIPTPIKRPARIVAGFTSATGLLFGATWLLDRALVWQLRREAINMAGGCAHDSDPETPYDVLASVHIEDHHGVTLCQCGKPATTQIHGWDVCEDHDHAGGPREAIFAFIDAPLVERARQP